VLASGRLEKADAIVKCFLKMETSTKMTDPRNISPRTDAFLSIIGPYVSAIEHHLHDAPFLVKGCDLKSRDHRLSKFLDNKVFIETDYSRFDMTISYDWIKCVQDPILLSFFKGDEWFSRALDLAADTFGISDSGLCYKILGTRCSGDSHTSIANGLINYFNTWFVFEDAVFNSVHEGDDGLVGLNQPESHLVVRPQLFDCMGFQIKSFVTNDLTQASFCGRFLSVTPDNKVASYCDPIRTLSKFHISLSVGDLRTLLLSKALSYNYTDGNTPIIGPICQAFIRHLGTPSLIDKAMAHVKKDRFILYDLKLDSADASRTAEVDENLRADFAKRTGIVPEAQRRWERHFTAYILDGSFGYDRIPCDNLEWFGLDREVFAAL